MFRTRMTELFGIRHPIMLAGMNWIKSAFFSAASVAECMAAAVSNFDASPSSASASTNVVPFNRVDELCAPMLSA